VAPVDGTDFDTLMKKADMAMYHAKGLGRGSFSFFDARMNKDSADRLALTTHLRHALSAGELRLVYQPQFALNDGRMIGVEVPDALAFKPCGRDQSGAVHPPC
jgi:predicted signal transduction protein with EAL and GGDEF domain